MKALHVLHRVCWYAAIVLFVAAGLVVGYALYTAGAQIASSHQLGVDLVQEMSDALANGETFVLADFLANHGFDIGNGTAEEVAAAMYECQLAVEKPLVAAGSTLSTFGLVSLGVVLFAVHHAVLSLIFRKASEIVKRARAKKECCCCEKPSDLDAQVEEVMRWKNLYVEGIITEREFIDKRNEILRIAK